ncbi:MAG: four helix bundle protein [Flavobacteriales bacterium]
MNRFKNLIVWQQALDLSVDVYRVTEKFPKKEVYGIASQMQRAGVSVPSNIAEGAARNHDGEFFYFLGIACGSAAELATQTIIAERLGYIEKIEADKILGETEHIMNRVFKLQQQLETKHKKRPVRS